MTVEQINKALLLEQCTFLPASFEKRFAANMAGLARSNPEQALTPKQAAWLDKQFYRYRNQIARADQSVKELMKEVKSKPLFSGKTLFD